MTEQPGYDPAAYAPQPPTDNIAGQPLTDEQAAALHARIAAQGATQPSPASEQAATAEQMTERGPMLPAENAMDQVMAQLKAMSDQLASTQSQLSTLQRQQEEAQAASGGPLVVRYAQAVADKAAALDQSRPDHADGHFSPLHEAAAALVEAAKAAAKDGSNASDVADASAAIERFITRTHPRAGGAQLDFSALRDDAQQAADEAAKLAS